MHFSPWIKAARPLSLLNIWPPVLVGLWLGRLDQWLTGWLLPGLLLSSWFGQLAIVFLNDWADRGADSVDHTLISGGSGVLPNGELKPGHLLAAGIAAALLFLSAMAIVSLYLERSTPFILAVLGLATFLSYSFPPLKANYRGGGEFLQALGCGIVLPAMAFASCGSVLSALPYSTWLALFLMAIPGAIGSTLPDLEHDRRTGKVTLCGKLGVRWSIGIAWLVLCTAFLISGKLYNPFAQIALVFPLLALFPGAIHIRQIGHPGLIQGLLLLGASSTGLLVFYP